ncbi:sensor histidine kinase [Streptomyces sp. NPDC048441]|uniref:sensor histidine kinase n=1 Tax=Streptomyces sp. NPDC048441 TaxID=3365552 RepID=UPI00371DFA3F
MVMVIRYLRYTAYSFLGAVMGLLPLAVAVFTASPKFPAVVRVVGFGLAVVLVVGAMGLPSGARRGCVGLADRQLGVADWQLGVDVPAPAAKASWADRLRTSAYLGAHMAIGGAVTVAVGLLLFVTVVLLTVWLGGGGDVANFGSGLRLHGGWSGAWALVASVGCLAAAGCAVLGGAALLRALAHGLLGPRPAERLAAAERQLRLLAQRNQLAQELHDSIGHTLTASTIQAAMAGELMDSDPAAARRALSSIEETSRAAMDDLDHVLGVLRQGQVRAPAPSPTQRTLADLDALTEHVRRAGVELGVETYGDLAHVPATVSREAYRIVQEGLTNALRYGGGSDGGGGGGEVTGIISLHVASRDGWLGIEVINPVAEDVMDRVDGTDGVDGASLAPKERGGHGLTGVSERVRLLRGEVSAGLTHDPATGPHWRLAARLPLRSAP